jgi:hypothetical protein
MNCRRVERRLALYVSDDLPRRRVAAVEIHLEQCPSCRHFLAELRRDRAVIQAHGLEGMDPALTADHLRTVLAGIRQTEPNQKFMPMNWSHPSRILPVTAVFIVVLAIAGWWLFKETDQPPVLVESPASITPQVVTEPSETVSEQLADVPPPSRTAKNPEPGPELISPPVKQNSNPLEDRQAMNHNPPVTPSPLPIETSRIPEEPSAAPVTQTTVRLATGNPRVVMYWILEKKGEPS